MKKFLLFTAALLLSVLLPSATKAATATFGQLSQTNYSSSLYLLTTYGTGTNAPNRLLPITSLPISLTNDVLANIIGTGAYTNLSQFFSNTVTLNPTSTVWRLNGMHLTNQAQRALVGQTIDVMPGTYWIETNEFSLLRNGINWNLRPGATIISGTAGDGGSIVPPFNDWSGVVTSYVFGAGTLIVSNDLCNVVQLTNVNSKVHMEVKRIQAANEMAAVLQDTGGGELTIYASDGIYADGYDAVINQCNPNTAKLYIYANNISGDTDAGDSAVEVAAKFTNPGDCVIRSSFAQGDLTLADNMDVELGTLKLGADNVIYSVQSQRSVGVLRNTYVYGTSNRTVSLISVPVGSGDFSTHGTFVQCTFVGPTNWPAAMITNDNGVATTFISSRFFDGFQATNSIRSRNSQKVVLVATDTPLGLHANISASVFTNTTEVRFRAPVYFDQGLDVVGDINTTALNTGTILASGQAALSGGLGLYNSITVSRVLMITADGDVTNVVSLSPSTEYVKADGTVGVPTGAQTPWSSDINGAGNDLTNVASVVINGASTVAGYTILSGTNDVPVVTQAAASNSVPVTNIVGLIHRAAAAYIEVDCNREQDIQITNRLAANTIVNWLNAAQGQVYQLRFTGAASGGSDYYVTNMFPSGWLVVNQSTNAAPLATQLPVLVGDGTGGELNMRAYKHVTGTNLIGALINQYAE